jgi:integrase
MAAAKVRRRKTRPDLWTKKVGGYGYTVWIFERTPGGNLYVRYFDPQASGGKGNWVPKGLGHTDRETAETFAKELSADLLRGIEISVGGAVTVGYLLDLYAIQVSAKKKGQQPGEDARRKDLWECVLGRNVPAEDIGEEHLVEFVERRRAGTIATLRKLAKNPSDTTIGADIIYLQSVFNWAHEQRVKGSDGKRRRLLAETAISGFARPSTKNPARTWATYDWYLKARPFAEKIGKQKLFAEFLDLLETLGWRVTPICELRRSDLDLGENALAPHGLIHKREDVDKENVDVWVPLPLAARQAIDSILAKMRQRKVIGDAPLFPAARSKGRDCWDRHYVDQRLRSVAKQAGLPAIGAHAFRRKWEEERRHLPEKDRMDASGRKDRETMNASYLRRDTRRILAVMEDPRKLRKEDVGGMVATQSG